MGRGHEFSRRHALLSVPVAGLAGCSWLIGEPPGLPPVPSSDSAIDIHCHIFNARDLPIEGFIDGIYISAGPGLKRYSEEALIAFLSLIMKGQAIAARDEIAEINASARFPDLRPESATDEFSEGKNAELLRQSVFSAASKLQDEIRALRSRPTVPGEEAAIVSKDRASARLRILNDLAAESAMPHVESNEPPTPATVADGAVNAYERGAGGNQFVGLLWLATLTTRPRMELARRLFALPDSKRGEVKVLAPAIVDYGYWLDDDDYTPLRDQIEVMSAIASHPPELRAVHAWVSFCPWRQLREPSQFDLIKQAVMEKGLLGVKLYPVMGFYPIGNAAAQARGERYPYKLEAIANFGQRMDDELRHVYRFCEDAGVPVVAHCSHSEYPHLFNRDQSVNGNVDLGMRGSPYGWEAVLNEFPNLRLNIGHAGGPWDLSLHPDHPPTDPLWTPKVIELVGKYRNAYTDIADYSAIYDLDQTDDLHILGLLKGYLDTNPLARAKMMYGTDWEMLSLTLGANQYYPQMRKLIALQLGLSSSEVNGFFGANAAKMTGLSMSGGEKPQTRLRLEAFYDRSGLNKEVLSAFDT